ncbi:MAG: DUF1499 domain-containing protein [Steroidobacteraceae bacterium]
MKGHSYPSLSRPSWPQRMLRFGIGCLLLGALVAALSGPSHRLGWLGFAPALMALGVGLALLLLGALAAIIAFLIAQQRQIAINRGGAALAIVAALALVGYLLGWIQRGTSVPPIHEISTDLDDPPQFAALIAERARDQAVNPPGYVREVMVRGAALDVPAAQRAAYPDVEPLQLRATLPEVMNAAADLAGELDWDVVARDDAAGRLEATDTTFFFGFKDDVVMRARPDGEYTRIDLRSKSRVGLGDAGTNARRVRRFLADLRKRLSSDGS